jgi:uncharacterized protein YbbC (DUF1343 family)
MKIPIHIGLHNLFATMPDYLRGSSLGLLAHAASVAVIDGRIHHAVNLIQNHPDLNLIRLFTPEHGLYGAAQAGESVDDGMDAATGLPVISLYGTRRAPEKEHLQDLDALLVDVQDVGVRCYTYLSTLKACLQICVETNTRLIVLDRPNPLGRKVFGEGVEAGFESFVSAHDVPFVHGLTLGELALRIAQDLHVEDSLEVIPVTGWRGELWNETTLPWIPPSPNLPTFQSAWYYPATVFFEGTNISEGRGTAFPFEQIGAPWLNGQTLAEKLNARDLPGIYFESARFTPTRSKHEGKRVEGIRLSGLELQTFDPLATAFALLQEVYQQSPKHFEWLFTKDGRAFIDLLYGASTLRHAVLAKRELE